MRNISPVVKDDDIEKKKHTHSVSDISAFPKIPDENAISEMGFTKNGGDYSKPDGGIPKSDLAADVQASLNKADTALQEHQSLTGYVKNDDSRLTDARPANGGNAATVNGHTVAADVPANAKFTDTTYSKATSSADGLMSAADKKKLDDMVNSGGGISTINDIAPTNGNIALTQSLIPSDGAAYQMPYYVQSGTVSVGSTAYNGVKLTFPKAFLGEPILLLGATVDSASGSLSVIANYKELTKDGFTLFARRFNSNGITSVNNNTPAVIGWVALGKI